MTNRETKTNPDDFARRNEVTTMWIEGSKEDAVTVDYIVTDLDAASVMLGYADYQDLVEKFGADDEDDSPLYFQHRAK